MIKVTVLYPNRDGATFDMAYYRDKHVPMARQLVGPACKGVEILEGRAGVAPDATPAFMAIANLLFESAESFQSSFGPHAPAIMGDLPNFTNVQPFVQINEIAQPDTV